MTSISSVGVNNSMFDRESTKTKEKIKNLKDVKSLPVDSSIEALTKDAENNEYLLGMVLLASGQRGNDTIYQNSLNRMNQALDNLPKNAENNSYKAWRLGRILLSADSAGDKSTVLAVTSQLKEILSDENTKSDEFTAWAWGYLATLNQ